MRIAFSAARAAGRSVAFTLSDIACIARDGAALRALIERGAVDTLFANEAEIGALAGEPVLDAAIAAVAPQVSTLVVTRGERGAVAVAGGQRVQVAAAPVARLVDTTGAGDLFAAGFLLGQARGLAVEECLALGAAAAAEVISHYGARPEADLRPLLAG